MRTLDQQMRDVEDLDKHILRAADRNYLPQSRDELQIRAIAQLTLAVLTLVKTLTEETKEGDRSTE